MSGMVGWEFEEPNPIKRCTIQLGLAWPLPPAVIRGISAIHGQFRRELPRKVEQQMLTVPMGGLSGPGALPPTRDLGGIIFDFVNPLGESSRGLVVGANLVNYFTASYTRWVEFWPFAARLLTAIGEEALKGAPLVSLALEYQDQFFWRGGNQELDFHLLFKSDCEYLPKRFLSQKDVCHNFQGWIERPDGNPPRHVIHNLNISLGSALENVSTCTAVFNHRTQFNTGLSFPNFAEIFEPTMLDMRKIDKELLISILDEQVSTRIPGLRE
jgi:uncharacterized protein (TIGR04255 family)